MNIHHRPALLHRSAAKVEREIFACGVGPGIDANVETMQGTAVLQGARTHRGAIERVKDIAANLRGVTHVNRSAFAVATP